MYQAKGKDFLLKYICISFAVFNIFTYTSYFIVFMGVCFPGGLVCEESACSAGDPGLIPGSGKSPGEGHSNPLQYSCLENSINKEICQGTVHGVAKSWTQLSDLTF